MAQSSYPFDGQATSESQYSQFFRELQDTGIAGSADSGALEVSADGSGMAVDVQPGFAIVRGHAYSSTAVETLTIEAADPTARLDTVVLRLDPAANSIVLAVLKGTPGAGAPAVTQTDTSVYELPLAVITVGSSVTSISPADVADRREYAGQRYGTWTTALRPAGPRLGHMGYNTQTAQWEFWNGVAWVALAPSVAWSDVSGLPASFPPEPHSHPVYWNDVLDKPATYDPSAHSHSWSSITGKPSQFDPLPHTHTWGQIQSRPEQYPPAPHTHGQYLTSDDTIGWANGSKRPHNNSVSGSGTWYAVWVEGDGRFARNTSSRRFKTNIHDFDVDTDAVMQLCPVIYDRKDTVDEETGEVKKGRRGEVGLIAEEVAEHLPWLVTYLDGEVDGLRYDLLGVALIPVVQEQARRIERLEEAVASLMERLS